MSDLKPSREPEQHPASGGNRFGPDTPHSFEDETWFRWIAESTSEREGASVAQAKDFIRANRQSETISAEWSRPRDENIPLGRTTTEDS